VGDDPVQHLPLLQVLAEQAHGHLGDREGIACVAPEVRRRRRVRLLADVAQLQVGDGKRGRRTGLLRCRVHHHRHRHVVEHTSLEQEHLAPTRLFGRRPDQLDRDRQPVCDVTQRECGPGGRRGDDVVPARVPDLG